MADEAEMPELHKSAGGSLFKQADWREKRKQPSWLIFNFLLFLHSLRWAWLLARYQDVANTQSLGRASESPFPRTTTEQSCSGTEGLAAGREPAKPEED